MNWNEESHVFSFFAFYLSRNANITSSYSVFIRTLLFSTCTDKRALAIYKNPGFLHKKIGKVPSLHFRSLILNLVSFFIVISNLKNTYHLVYETLIVSCNFSKIFNLSCRLTLFWLTLGHDYLKWCAHCADQFHSIVSCHGISIWTGMN